MEFCTVWVTPSSVSKAMIYYAQPVNTLCITVLKALPQNPHFSGTRPTHPKPLPQKHRRGPNYILDSTNLDCDDFAV